MYKLPDDVGSKYRFVTLASKRAEQLQMGVLPRVENAGGRKPTVVAQEEVATGIIGPWHPEQEEVAEVLDEED